MRALTFVEAGKLEWREAPRAEAGGGRYQEPFPFGYDRPLLEEGG